MEDMVSFFKSFFPSIAGFFNIEFPMLGLTVLQVLLGVSFMSFSILLLSLILKNGMSIRDAAETAKTFRRSDK